MKYLSLLTLLLLSLPLRADAWPVNGGAEQGERGWSGMSCVDKDFFSGRYCFEIPLKKEQQMVNAWFSRKVLPGQKYTISAWVRSNGNKASFISIHILRSDRKPMVILKDAATTKEWTHLSGTYTGEKSVPEIKLAFVLRGEAGNSSILIDDIICNAPKTQFRVRDIDHRKNLIEDAKQGHDLDKLYYDAGSRIDIVNFDFIELEQQGKAVPIELRRKVIEADAQLRHEWLTLDSERYAFWRQYSRSNSDIGDILKFREKISVFGARAKKLADKIEKESAPFRENLVYRKINQGPNFWNDNFVLALDVESTFYGAHRLKYPGNYINYEYAAKACNDLGVNFVTLLTSPLKNREKTDFLNTFDRFCKMPFLVWSTDEVFFADKDLISFNYFTDTEKMICDIDRFLAHYDQYSSFVGIQIDEPRIKDTHSRYGELKLDAEWKRYLEKRRGILMRNGVTNPRESLEWQLFKKDFLAEHIGVIYDTISKRGKLPLACIMNKYREDAAMCSYVSLGRVLPIASTDLYNDGTVLESFTMSLFKNAMKGQAILIPGAGFSCKSRDSFKRSVSNGLVHADGIHMWTSTHAWKYRDPNYYWRYGGNNPNLNDRKRAVLWDWFPWVWEVMRERYHFAVENKALLAKRKSLAQVAVVVSERTQLTRKPIWYWDDNLAVYEELIRNGIPVDACFLESMTDEQWRRYKVIVAPGIQTITPDEFQKLEQWVADGGKLLTTSDFASCDEWGREKTKKNKSFGIFFSQKRIGIRNNTVPTDGFRYTLVPQAASLIQRVVSQNIRYPWQVRDLPKGVEVQIQECEDNSILIQLLDFIGNRTITGLKLNNQLTGEVSSIKDFHVHNMIHINSKTLQLKELQK